MIAKSIAYRIIVGIGLILLGIIAIFYVNLRRKIRRGENLQLPELSQFDYSFLFFLVIPFLVCVLLGSAFIDYIRLETTWHPVVKFIVSALIFLVTFITFVTTVFIFELNGLI